MIWHKIIEWIDLSVAKDSSSVVPKTKLWFSKSSEASEFHGRSNISLFPVKPTFLHSAVSPFACGQSHSASPRLRAILSSKRGSQRFMCALQMKTHTRKGEFRI